MALLGCVIGLLSAPPVLAQEPTGATVPMEEAPPDGTVAEQPPAEAVDESQLPPEDMGYDPSMGGLPDLPVGTEPLRDPTDPWEDPHQGYYFVGAFYRHVFLPAFLIELFVDESVSGSNPGFGLEFTYRKDNFDIVGSLWWSGASAEGPFRASGDPIEDTEWINSGLSIIYASAAFLWSTPLNDIFALEYGLDIGLGLVLGGFERTEAYDTTPTGGERTWAPCTALGNPSPTYCDEVDPEERIIGRYPYDEDKWSGGGSIPNVFPWLAIPHLALRIKPIHQLMMRIEGGFGVGFFLGGSINYGF